MQRHILHACGHAQDHYLIADYAADYDRQTERLARERCRSCSTEQSGSPLAGRGESNGVNLSILQGSPKQIAWAESIRRKRISYLRDEDPHAVSIVAAIEDAKWWIEGRAWSDADLISMAAAAVAVDVRP